jgi:hypothetical protein
LNGYIMCTMPGEMEIPIKGYGCIEKPDNTNSQPGPGSACVICLSWICWLGHRVTHVGLDDIYNATFQIPLIIAMPQSNKFGLMVLGVFQLLSCQIS